MIVLLSQLAFADPAVLRSPIGDAGIAVGTTERSLGGWFAPGVGAAVELTGLGAVGVSVARQWRLTEANWTGEAVIHTGLTVPLRDSVPGLNLGAALRGGFIGPRSEWTLGIAVPAVVSPLASRWPIMGEIQGGGQLGKRLWVGGRLGVGPVITPGFDTAVRFEPALTVGTLLP